MFTTNRFASLPVDNYTVDEESSVISISTSFDESPRLCVRRTAKLLRELNPTPLYISTSSTSFLRSSPVVDEYAREQNAYVIRRLLTLHRDRRRRGFAADAALARLSHASLEKLLPQVDQSPRNQVEDSILLDLEDDDGFPRDATSCNAGPIKYDVFCSPYHCAVSVPRSAIRAEWIPAHNVPFVHHVCVSMSYGGARAFVFVDDDTSMDDLHLVARSVAEGAAPFIGDILLESHNVLICPSMLLSVTAGSQKWEPCRIWAERPWQLAEQRHPFPFPLVDFVIRSSRASLRSWVPRFPGDTLPCRDTG